MQDELDQLDREYRAKRLRIIQNAMDVAAYNDDDEAFAAAFEARDAEYRAQELRGMTDEEASEYAAERRWEAGAMGETDSIWYPI